MKVVLQRRHTCRPENYEAVTITATLEVDSENEADSDYFEGDIKQTGKLMSEDLDHLLDTDVDRTLRLDGQYVNDMHLWVFYGRD